MRNGLPGQGGQAEALQGVQGGGQLLQWLNLCIYPSESRFADAEFAQRAAVEFCNRRIAAGTTTAMVFGSSFPRAQDALFTQTQRSGLRIVSGRGIQTVGPETARPLLTSESDAIRLTREEIDKWHAADTGNASTGDPGNGGVSNINQAGKPNPDPHLLSTVAQIESYLNSIGGAADPSALYLISSGGNDFSYAHNFLGGAAQAYMYAQAQTLATEIANSTMVPSTSSSTPLRTTMAINWRATTPGNSLPILMRPASLTSRATCTRWCRTS